MHCVNTDEPARPKRYSSPRRSTVRCRGRNFRGTTAAGDGYRRIGRAVIPDSRRNELAHHRRDLRRHEPAIDRHLDVRAHLVDELGTHVHVELTSLLGRRHACEQIGHPFRDGQRRVGMSYVSPGAHDAVRSRAEDYFGGFLSGIIHRDATWSRGICSSDNAGRGCWWR